MASFWKNRWFQGLFKETLIVAQSHAEVSYQALKMLIKASDSYHLKQESHLLKNFEKN